MTTMQFMHYLRHALDHLYDPGSLARSPLVTLFGVAGGTQTPLALRQMLMDTIESLKPGENVPPHSPAWRAYQVLSCRYVQQFGQREVADQIGLSVRHLRREQEAALEVLATRLWAQFKLEGEVKGQASTDLVPTSTPEEMAPSVNEELAWLQRSSLCESANVAEELSTALHLAKPVAAQHKVHLEMALPDNLPDLAMHPMVLRQALLSLLTVAIGHVPGGELRISARPDNWDVEIQMLATNPRPGPRPVSNSNMDNLDMARRLARMFGGELSLFDSEAAFAARLTLPSLEQLPVLAIDDNEDTLHLFRRYASGTRYNLVGTRDPEEALLLAEKTSPRVIVLDVMMPRVDGWELLGRLHQHPLISHVPIIVCTVLAQKELALALGARDLLHKPVSREAFLEVLGRYVLPKVTGSG